MSVGGEKRRSGNLGSPPLPLGDDLEEGGRKGEMAIGLCLLIPPSPDSCTPNQTRPNVSFDYDRVRVPISEN